MNTKHNELFISFLESLKDQDPALISHIIDAAKIVFESDDGELWTKDVHKDSGKMHKQLGLKEGEKIIDAYSSGKKLAQDLLKSNKGDKRKTGGQLGFVANVGGENKQIFKDALSALKDL